MPELPEVETARALIAEHGLRRRIADVDDTDTYVCRPHGPGEIKAAIVGRELLTANRIGKTMWCETSEEGPDLGLHLGMADRRRRRGGGRPRALRRRPADLGPVHRVLRGRWAARAARQAPP